MRKYEPFHPIDHALSPRATLMAFVKTFDGEYPTLCVNEDQLTVASEMKLPFEVRVDNELRNQEWYVECNGKRFGSIGC